ncbi:hypothetical protein QVD17_18563 [Tagetes erecta]|uniref:Protein kinase domain-containing protein n=1 Tax=Tagetes erecta TaxID=13708 RepID=A0AAD8KLF0_TARER|nr:hypothetical protein QVD17_18563 [Tagetes erecta]
MVTKESDVYSFGVVLFEVLCGRLCNNRSQDGVLLTAEVAKEYYSNNKLDEIIDPVLREQMNKKSLEKYSAIAYSCLQERQQRPQMYEVRKKLEEALKIQDFYTQTPEGNHLQMPYSEIDDAIESYFKAEIGSEEYRIDVPEQEGYLYVHDIHTQVTVRDYNYWSFDSEFYADLKWLMDQQHENVVTLIGYCDEADHKCIVYEYPKHGSLNDYIECSNELNHTLTWLERLKIIVDVANGMEHIQNCGGRLIAITSTNILLYDKWLAKISNRRYFSARFEHLEPYHDLYIYIGMLLFELLCGRLSTVYEHCRRGCLSPIEAKQHYESKELDKIIDPILRKQMSLESLTKFSALAYKCLQTPPDDPSLLIDMKKELEETLKFEVRYWRSFFSRHWYILNVNDLSPGTDIVMMQHQDTKRLEGPSGSREDRGDK